MDAVYPACASSLVRGRRRARGPQRARTRTQPVTFAEIKEVDEESEDAGEACVGAGGARRGRDELCAGAVRAVGTAGGGLALDSTAPLARQFVESRRRRARKDVIPEPPEEPPLPRSASEPRVP